MARNCPYYEKGRCAPPGHDEGHMCSYRPRTYKQCSVFAMVSVRMKGGSNRQALQAMLGTQPHPKKKSWQFWK